MGVYPQYQFIVKKTLAFITQQDRLNNVDVQCLRLCVYFYKVNIITAVFINDNKPQILDSL
jgi:hypothetical protein